FAGARERLRRLAARVRAHLAAAPPPAAPRSDPQATGLLWFLSMGAIYAAWLSPKTPIFGGTKHWMTAYPFLALFAGVGFDDTVRAARAQVLRLRRRFSARARASPVMQAVRAPAVLA